jgi:hypothetical protein
MSHGRKWSVTLVDLPIRELVFYSPQQQELTGLLKPNDRETVFRGSRSVFKEVIRLDCTLLCLLGKLGPIR